MSVLNREALEASPLADLHEIAADVGIDGYRRLRKADLIDRLLEDKEGGTKPTESNGSERSASRSREPRGRSSEREGRGRQREDRGGERAPRSREPRSRSGERSAATASAQIEGALTIQSSGSGFVSPKDGGSDVYVSAAQIRRLELSDGDVVGGPTRPARRSEKHPSLVRIETINGKSADEVTPPVPAKGATTKRAAKAAPSLPTERWVLSGDDTLALLDRVAPIGRGSRVVLHGGPHSGKSTAARALAGALKASGAEVFVALSGVRTEETGDWASLEPTVTETLDSSPDSRAKAIERALDKAKRAAGKSGHSVLVVDSVDDLPGAAVRKTLAAAGAASGGGSLTVIAVAAGPVGGETTVVGFDQALAAAGKFPSVRVRASSTLRPDLLLDARSLKASRKAHSDAVKKER